MAQHAGPEPQMSSVSPEDLRKQLDSIHSCQNAQKLTEMSIEEHVDFALFQQLTTPEAIANRFTSVYETEWKKANQALSKTWSQDKVVYVLMRIVRSGYEFCQEAAERQLKLLLQSAESVMLNPFSPQTVKNTRPADGELTEGRDQMTAYQRSCAARSISSVQQHFIRQRLPQIFNLEEMDHAVQTYVQTVIAVLWLMCLNSYPLSIYWQAQGEQISGEHFNMADGSKGKTVDWTLWPAVVKQIDRHVIRKGVVLPIK